MCELSPAPVKGADDASAAGGAEVNTQAMIGSNRNLPFENSPAQNRRAANMIIR